MLFLFVQFFKAAFYTHLTWSILVSQGYANIDTPTNINIFFFFNRKRFVIVEFYLLRVQTRETFKETEK